MLVRASLILLLLLGVADDGGKQGRRGNAHYKEGQFREAADAYRSGLAAVEEAAPGPLRYGLLNNLGAALFRMNDVRSARTTFDQALAAAPTSQDYARTAYNAGNAAYSGKELEAALDFYRKALLADPDNEDAKFNYEFVKRQQQQQQQQQQQNGGQGSKEDQQQNDAQNQPGQQEQQNQDQQQQQQDSDQNQGQEPQQQPDEPQQNEPQEGSAPEPDPNELSREQAERILQALENEEEQLLRQVQKLKARPRRVEKDW